MPKIITVAHQKGGVGKSTLALNLAACFIGQLNIALVDIDPQGSISGLKELFPDITIITEDQFSQIQALDYDVVIVDTPPYLSARLPELFQISDYVLVPTKAGFFDVMAIKGTLELINQAQQLQPGLKAGIVLNMVKHRSGINSEVTELLKSMEAPTLKTVIHDRVSFARSPINGGVLTSEDKKAKEEITSLAGEIVEAIK
ncbi:ParA family protein [Adhaeribacter aquaticus]|uniref:ParA family protein n=1 Tax=Adhaeribacter aquaticus TaxID=299567 RepID=UPI0003FDDDD4|nr:ParA family protein [Adhaeribacter aquaticus]